MKTNLNSIEKHSKVLGIDIGGTGIKTAKVDIKKGKIVSEISKIPTPQPATPTSIFNEIKKMVQHFKWNGPIGCGYPGVIKNGITLTAANVDKKWIGYQALSELQTLTKHSVNILNDADAAALAEMEFGAGRTFMSHGGGIVMMITLGTGIGTALFADGHLVPNTELGHIEIDGVDAEKRAATVIREREGLSWAEWGERVNKYLQTIENLLSPDVFIIGGGVSESSEKFFPFLHVKAKLLPAQMANSAGIVGAALTVTLG